MALFEETAAYLHGHFRLTSGLHSSEYLQCAKVLSVPAYAERLGQELARRIAVLVGGAPPQVVVSPAIGGIVIGHEVAKALKGNNGKALTEMEELTKRTVIVKSDPALHQEQFDIN